MNATEKEVLSALEKVKTFCKNHGVICYRCPFFDPRKVRTNENAGALEHCRHCKSYERGVKIYEVLQLPL